MKIGVKDLVNSTNNYSTNYESNISKTGNKNIARLVNEYGKIKNCKIGFSWTSFLFMFFVPLSRLDFKNFFIQIFTLSILANISSFLMTILYLVFATTYNKSYIKSLIKKGYIPYDKFSADLLRKKGICFNKIYDEQDKITTNSQLHQVYSSDNTVLDSVTNYERFNDDTNNIKDLDNDFYDDDYECYDDDEISLDELGINFTISINGKEFIDNDIKVNDIAPEGYHKFLEYEKVVGVTFDDRDILVEKFINGSNRKITLSKDPLNEYDPFAIKVIGSCSYNGISETDQLGFLEKNISRKLSNFNDIKATVNAIAHPNKIRLDIWVTSDEYEQIKPLEDIYKDIQKNDSKISKLIDKASKFEDDKNIDKAIEYYEKAIALNSDGNYPYDRLAILYRKNKDYDNEIRVLNKAIEVFELLGKISQRGDIYPKLDKFKERLSKSELLKEKSILKQTNVKSTKKSNDKIVHTKKTTIKNKDSKKINLNQFDYTRIISLDFETANNKRASVCSIGYVIEENKKVIKEDEIIVNPKSEFSNINVKIHRIKDTDVEDAPTWDIVWKQIEDYITDSTLVIAHNLKSMELACIKQECERYNMDLPKFLNSKNSHMICDTLQLARETLPNIDNYKLNTLCEYFNIELNHHNALSDAKACLDLFHHLRGDYVTNE